jgi:rare lipoprotein A
VGWVSPRLQTGCAYAPVRPRVRLAISLLLHTGLALAVASCGPGGNGEKLGERVVPLGEPVPKGGGTYMTGAPYQVAGVWYTPREDSTYDRVGTASWYGELFHGRRTANGEIYDMDRLSAAHPTLPLPVYAQVTNLANGRTIVVRVNDRGPYANDRIIDLSRRSADLLGFRNRGTAQVRVRYLKRAPLNGDDSYERRFVANQSWMHVAANGVGGQRAPDPMSVASLPAKPAPSPRALKNGTVTMASAGPQAPIAPSRNNDSGAAPPQASAGGGAFPRLLIQAGSFKSKANADKARLLLAELAPVEVTPVEAAGETYFRVRVGPFSGQTEAQAALARVTQAGYAGARIVAN